MRDSGFFAVVVGSGGGGGGGGGGGWKEVWIVGGCTLLVY